MVIPTPTFSTFNLWCHSYLVGPTCDDQGRIEFEEIELGHVMMWSSTNWNDSFVRDTIGHLTWGRESCCKMRLSPHVRTAKRMGGRRTGQTKGERILAIGFYFYVWPHLCNINTIDQQGPETEYLFNLLFQTSFLILLEYFLIEVA